MKIIYIHQYYHNPSMSGSTRSYEMARRLVQMGHEVEMITSTQNYTIDSPDMKTTDSGIRVNWIHVKYSNHMNFWARMYSFFKFAVLAFLKAKNLNADIIYASSTPLTIALPGIFAARLSRIPFYFEVRDLWPEIPIAMGYLKNPILRFLARRLEQFAYNSSKGIVALTEGMKEGIVRTGYPKEKVIVIPNGADLDFFEPEKISKKSLRLKYGFLDTDIIMLYPGTIGHVNNLEYLVELATKCIDNSRLKFLVVGDGVERNLIVNKAHNAGVLKKNMFFINRTPKNEMPIFFSMSDMVISTILPLKELEANCANKFFDALASGTCMVVNHGGWQEKELERYSCGFSLPRNISDAHHKLNSLIINPSILMEMGKNGRNLAEERYSREKLAQKLALFLQKKT